jgi:hypothetical protein
MNKIPKEIKESTLSQKKSRVLPSKKQMKVMNKIADKSLKGSFPKPEYKPYPK